MPYLQKKKRYLFKRPNLIYLIYVPRVLCQLFSSSKFICKMANDYKLVAFLLIVGLTFAIDLPEEKLSNALQKFKKEYLSKVPEKVNNDKRGASYTSN